MRLVLASNNRAKLAELQALLAPLGCELVAQGALGIDEADEPHASFVENALAKARHAARASGGAAIADDSGLVVDALGGQPGVASAHWAPMEVWTEPSTAAAPAAVAADADAREARRRRQDAANNERLLAAMRGVADRRARFVSTLVALRHAGDPEPLVAVGRWEARILEAPRGTGGFGYDPLVFVPALGKSVAELDAEAKNRHSHRALAAARLRALIEAHWRPFPLAGERGG